jgi:predicted cation transporter
MSPQFKGMITITLGFIFTGILVLPLSVRRVEENIEVFLLAMAFIAVTASHTLGLEAVWTPTLIESALLEPVNLTLATFVFGVIFRMIRPVLKKKIVAWEEATGPRLFAALVIFSLGILSSVITAIIAALILCEIISALSLDKKYETILTVLACFSIGMGAALTPIGEPLSTIAIAKLRGGGHTTDFLFLLKLVGTYIIPGLLFISAAGAFLGGVRVSSRESLTEDQTESLRAIFIRALKVYFFVMALILLGRGFKPVVDVYIAPMSAGLLYWINMSSAILDNATLAAAELGPQMSTDQITGILMGVVISGGMLIPGNIPNIIAASKLRISSRSWAVIGLPAGLVLMGTYYLILFII